MFLTDEETERITGYKLPAWQAKWLMKHGIPFTVAGSGRLNVLRAEIERRHSSGQAGVEQNPQPDFSAIEG